jgi:hypothetical protein
VAFGNGAADFGYRIALWVQQGSSGKAVTDNTVFLMTIGVIAWVQGLAGAWGLYRRQDVVLASLPTAIVLGTNATYTGDARAPFAIFLITLLLLAVTLNVASLQRRWHALNVAFPSGLLFDVTVSSLVVICALALLALMGPRLGENLLGVHGRTVDRHGKRFEPLLLGGEQPSEELWCRARPTYLVWPREIDAADRDDHRKCRTGVLARGVI